MYGGGGTTRFIKSQRIYDVKVLIKYFTSFKGARNTYFLGGFELFLLSEVSLCCLTGLFLVAGQRTVLNGGTRWRRLKGEIG